MNQNNIALSRIAVTMREETYLKIMRLLEQNPNMTQRELAEQLGVSVGSVNYCIKALMEKGWLKVKSFIHSKNKFGYVYVLISTGIAERVQLTTKFLARKVAEYENLKCEIEVLKAAVDDDEISSIKGT